MMVDMDFFQQHRAMHIKQTHISNVRPNLLKEHVSPAHRLTEEIKHENTTRGIKHWGLVGYLSFLPRIKFGVTGQESSPQSPTFHTATVTNKTKA